jgi:hypothetical protein
MRAVVGIFEGVHGEIRSPEFELPSNAVLARIRPGLEGVGFTVESGKTSAGKMKVPVLFGLNGSLEKSFEADAYCPATHTVIEVEAGRGLTNNQFLKDLFEPA